jgi:hypothetical protein
MPRASSLLTRLVLATAAVGIVLVGIIVFIATRPRRFADSAFSVEGIVTDSSGSPVSGATVSLRTAPAVFDGLAPVPRAHSSTDEAGRFRFAFISATGDTVAYRLLVEKQGFAPANVRGTPQDVRHHNIVLARSVAPPPTP